MMITTFWDITPYSLVEVDVSEVRTASIIREITAQKAMFFIVVYCP
jgi:hypothetical protein